MSRRPWRLNPPTLHRCRAGQPLVRQRGAGAREQQRALRGAPARRPLRPKVPRPRVRRVPLPLGAAAARAMPAATGNRASSGWRPAEPDRPERRLAGCWELAGPDGAWGSPMHIGAPFGDGNRHARCFQPEERRLQPVGTVHHIGPRRQCLVVWMRMLSQIEVLFKQEQCRVSGACA
jgi:hypothetical protein